MERLRSLTPLLFLALLQMAPWPALSAPSAPKIVAVFEGIKREIAVDEGRLVGRFASYYRCVFERVDGDFQFVEMPLAQMLYQLKKGGIAAGLPLVQTSDRDEYADFGGLLFQTEYVYLLLKDLPPLGSTEGLTYAFVRRFVGDQLLQGQNPRVIHVSHWGQAVEMLKLGRADVVVLPWVLVDKYMDGYQGDYFERTAAWVNLSLYVSHAHGDSQLTASLRRAIRTCRYRNDLD
ncbi:transporter substrate-binding domain-containing protein [Marinobacter qingdaonensis]|uniref:Transporter substrate-binding domain-containing protein n=1 Tax=Marinobacter qingdaonensis TaxID=3108486 RepID=A0ABU5NUS2_9GAMM|nr:transporter substrate-binding domain-containing protein [Marinobacter sp. ASW11-75]MEA1079549.1 transporter substrate-binding domain-containing protein [Marinobacter sp. ASW11-75]MEE2763243.1 transporter substrate-binding domain-containing protein [Pseudomonadota bacterium]